MRTFRYDRVSTISVVTDADRMVAGVGSRDGSSRGGHDLEANSRTYLCGLGLEEAWP